MSKPKNELALLFDSWNDFGYLMDFFMDMTIRELTREKARNWDRTGHASWPRVYAIRLEKNVFVITGGAIKLTRTMLERPHTQEQLDRLNACRKFLVDNGVFDSDSFISLTEEDEL